MGGDIGLEVTIPASLYVLRENPDVRFIFVGIEDQLKPILDEQAADVKDRIEIQHASQLVAMDERPSQALRFKKDSSMRVAINLVKEGRADACVSAGNTGALMATARFVLKTIRGISRPAIIARFPTQKADKVVRMLDLGANVESPAEHIFQFALMGSIMAEASDNLERPTVGLLNIGEEEIKGNETVKQVSEMLSNCKPINYVGYIEGDVIFTGDVDVVVCDGFVGNIALKACEGIATLIRNNSRRAFKRNWLTRFSAVPALPVLKRITRSIDPRRRNGASMVGLNGIVIKSHGGADRVAFAHAIREAILEVDKNIPEVIRQRLETVFNHTSSSN